MSILRINGQTTCSGSMGKKVMEGAVGWWQFAPAGGPTKCIAGAPRGACWVQGSRVQHPDVKGAGRRTRPEFGVSTPGDGRQPAVVH